MSKCAGGRRHRIEYQHVSDIEGASYCAPCLGALRYALDRPARSASSISGDIRARGYYSTIALAARRDQIKLSCWEQVMCALAFFARMPICSALK
jgi:hypothetical protein